MTKVCGCCGTAKEVSWLGKDLSRILLDRFSRRWFEVCSVLNHSASNNFCITKADIVSERLSLISPNVGK